MNFSQLPTEELVSKKNSIIVVTSILAGMLLALLAMGVYLILTKSFSVILIIPFCMAPILISNFIIVGHINKQLKDRNLVQ